MPEDKVNRLKESGSLKIVGRDSRVDLSRYTVSVHGREVVDYEKLKREEPTLYEEILKVEKEWDLAHTTK